MVGGLRSKSVSSPKIYFVQDAKRSKKVSQLCKRNYES